MKQHLLGMGLAACLSAAAASATEALMDPTRPVTFNVAAPRVERVEPVLRLEAIMRSGERHLAIVNGKLVRVGDRIDGALVRGIEADRLTYVVEGHERVAKLSSQAVKVRRTREVAP